MSTIFEKRFNNTLFLQNLTPNTLEQKHATNISGFYFIKRDVFKKNCHNVNKLQNFISHFNFQILLEIDKFQPLVFIYLSSL